MRCECPGAYRAGSIAAAAAADCGAADWGRWEAEDGSHHGTFHWGPLDLCGRVCHQRHCQGLQGSEGVSKFCQQFYAILCFVLFLKFNAMQFSPPDADTTADILRKVTVSTEQGLPRPIGEGQRASAAL